jgi:signal transduction histidine kinase
MRLRTERLMAFVVHDLKNPVNAIDLHAQLLLRDASLSARARDSGERVRAEVKHLLRMILDLLDVAKSDEGKLVVRRAPIDLPALAADVAAAFELRARNGAVSIVTAIELDPPLLLADIELVRRVLENLVENAVRHSPEGGTVRIGARRDGDGTVLTVADEGGGVPPELRERIFDPYVQVETADLTLTRGGRGLGLAFCRLVVEAHGGSIGVDDGAPSGAVFRARLPDAAP